MGSEVSAYFFVKEGDGIIKNNNKKYLCDDGFVIVLITALKVLCCLSPSNLRVVVNNHLLQVTSQNILMKRTAFTRFDIMPKFSARSSN